MIQSSEIKTKNLEVVKRVMEGQWWKEEFNDCFFPECTLEFPYAPPGMVQNLCVGQVLAHKHWMRRTVKNWSVRDMRIFGPRTGDGTDYFVIRYAGGDVFWAGRDGHFESRHTTMIKIRGGRIFYMKEWFNPLKYLEAACIEAPKFLQDFDREAAGRARPDLTEYEYTPDAIARRAEDNVDSFVDTDFFTAVKRRTYSPDYRHAIWNAPPDMLEEYPPGDYHVFDHWISESLTEEWHGHPDIINHPTDDPHVYFFESGGYGIAEWRGNGVTGGYGNRYIKYLELDDNGFILRYDENLNPIAKLNSINASIPSFPYLF